MPSAFLTPWQPLDPPPPAGVDRLLGSLPRWLQGPLARTVCEAIGAQLDALDGLAEADQLFVSTATWGLAFDADNPDGTVTPTGWERDYGIPVAVEDGYPARRARVLAKMQGGVARTAADFAALVEDLLTPPATCPPVVYQVAAQWAIFKLCDRGFPSNFIDVEAGLALAGPAHLGLWVGAWDDVNGLLDWQLDLEHGEAIDVLTDAEIDGP